MYLLDTNVLSRTAPSQTRPDPDLIAWLDRNGERLFLSAVSVTEVRYGIARLAHRGASRKAELLQAWLGDLLTFHGRRVLPVDTDAALRAGELLATAHAAGAEIDVEDAFIAATADRRGMTVLTGNVRHFAPMGVVFVDPFETLPPDT